MSRGKRCGKERLGPLAGEWLEPRSLLSAGGMGRQSPLAEPMSASDESTLTAGPPAGDDQWRWT